MKANSKELKLIEKAKAFLKDHPFEWKEDEMLAGYRSVNGKQINDKIDEFLKSIGFEGDQYDYEWEHNISLTTVMLKAMEN